ncbi:hypothetical protein [Bacillus solitudinis]|uniref:hypothetical protein n=1 Tax=Bacillus solitudinis TaxID=2014074 RepID=UPI000C23A276|nr:hypothetical protein [Bacillus solitudinis]
MSLWLAILLVVVVIAVIVLIISSKKNKGLGSRVDDESMRTCKNCSKTIAEDYLKSLCPHCNKFLI